MDRLTIQKQIVLDTKALDFFYWTYSKNTMSITLAVSGDTLSIQKIDALKEFGIANSLVLISIHFDTNTKAFHILYMF